MKISNYLIASALLGLIACSTPTVGNDAETSSAKNGISSAPNGSSESNGNSEAVVGNSSEGQNSSEGDASNSSTGGVSSDKGVSSVGSVEIKLSVESSNFEYEVTNINNYTITVSKIKDTIDLVDYWAMPDQPSNMEVFGVASFDTLMVSYRDTTSFGITYDWTPTVKTTARFVFESGIEEINFITIKSPGGRGPIFDEVISYRIANVDTTLNIN